LTASFAAATTAAEAHALSFCHTPAAPPGTSFSVHHDADQRYPPYVTCCPPVYATPVVHAETPAQEPPEEALVVVDAAEVFVVVVVTALVVVVAGLVVVVDFAVVLAFVVVGGTLVPPQALIGTQLPVSLAVGTPEP